MSQLNLPDPEKISEFLRETAERDILPLFKQLKDHEINDKESGEIVTAADIRAENRLINSLTKVLPKSTTVGEEEVSGDKSVINRLTGEAPVWVIDPLDGTRNFSKGKDRFAVIVALCLQGETLMGWIYNPIEEVVVIAEKGQGTWENGQRVSLSKPPKIEQMRGSVSKRRYDRLKELANQENGILPADMVRYRCVGMEYVDLARGILHFAEYGILKPWDHAAGLLIHAEAGGYSAFTKDDSPYKAGPTVRDHIIAAPDQSSWRSLKALLDVLQYAA